MPLRDDFLLRQVKQLAQALARIMGLRVAGDFAQAQEQLESAWAELGIPFGLMDKMSPPALATFLGHPDKVCAVAALLREEAALDRARGAVASAERKEELAAALFTEKT